MITQKKIQHAFTIFGILVFLFNLYELITARLPRGEMAVVMLECLAGIALIYLPQLIRKFLKVQLPVTIIYFYWFFLGLSVFLGTCLHLIRFIPGWDKLLHGVSPMLLTALGYGICGLLLKDKSISDVSPWLFLIFGFAFAGVCGVFWEFWEFLCDTVANMNLQRYLDSPDNSGPALIGRAALMDTMGDMFTNIAGALIMGTYAFFKKRKDPLYFEAYRIRLIK